jgi:hypothetical protein
MTGAKGLNLAVADVVVLGCALQKFYSSGSRHHLFRGLSKARMGFDDSRGG